MNNISIIGVGKIGIRHLESLLKINSKLNIYLFDKNLNLKKLNQYINLKKIKSFHKIYLYKDLFKTSIHFDILIISTNSDVRYEVFNKFIKLNKVKNIIFEKIVFQNNFLYKKAISTLNKNKTKAYVNLPRRVYPVYNYVKKNLSKNLPLNFTYSSSNWNLASNSIHFIDLFCYLENSYFIKADSDLEKSIVTSKRKNFLEFKGSLKFESNTKGSLFLSDINNNHKYINCITIKQKNKLFLVFESENKCIFIKKNNKISVKHFDFNTPFQSQLTKNIVINLLNKKKISLPTLKLLKKNHDMMINIFKNHLKEIKYTKKNNFIT